MESEQVLTPPDPFVAEREIGNVPPVGARDIIPSAAPKQEILLLVALAVIGNKGSVIITESTKVQLLKSGATSLSSPS